MNIRNFILLIILSLSTVVVKGQTSVLQDAVIYYEKGKLDQAKSNIDIAIKNKKLKKDPTAWYLRGFIYKDIYKENPAADSLSEIRDISVNSFLKLLTFDDTEKYKADCQSNFKFLASTFYNDAIRTLEQGKFKQSAKFYTSFENTLFHAKDTSIDLKQYEINYYLSKGSKYSELYKNNTKKDNLNKAIKAYDYIIAKDAKNIKANYNLGVIYYNEAVAIINNLDYDGEIDLVAFGQLEDKSIELFKQSLPYMEQAYQQNPENKDTLQGLAGIHFGLRNMDKSNEFKEKLAALEK